MIASMNRVWKVASRWSETGTVESSILDIFRRHNVVFVGKFQDRFRQIAVGDLIAISDAKQVVAMGLAMTLPKPVSELGIEFTEDDLRKFDCEDHVLGCRVSFSDLGEEEQPSYRVSAFHSVNERADEFRRIFTAHRHRFEEKRQFEIKARSCTLLARDSTSPADGLWQEGLVFRVPVYQRAYSWKEGEVRRLLGDLLANFLGMNGRPVEEPMFIGTMQLTEKRLLDGTNGREVQEVIDGQQRLSTLLLLLNILKGRRPELPVWTGLDLATRIETAVSSGEQQRYLREAIEADLRNLPAETQNPYLHVVPLIQQLLDEATVDSSEEDKSAPSAPLEVERFAAYLLSRVYFVVIETRATLSKTLQIFDAINTSGMDLNGGDVFKVRYYEYLRVTHNVQEAEFDRISGLYQAIDERNRAAGQTICGIEEILSLARHILVARHELPKALHDYGASIFFDRFFDTVLSINDWPNFTLATCRRTDVRLEEFARLIAVRFDWSKDVPALSPEARSMLDFIIRWSRYSKYDFLIVLFRDRFGADLALTERFIIQLAKLLVIFSIIYWKAVYELHGIMHRAVGMMFGPASVSTAEDVIDCLRRVAADNKQRIETAFDDDAIADNVRAKNLACRLAAFLHELEKGSLDAEQMRSLIFDTEIDIEHIESVNHKDENERAKVHALWQGELHRIGNLIVLESSLNRSISNEDYETVKVRAYRNRSAFQTVRMHAEAFPMWNLEMCKERKEKLKRTLVDYLCQ